MNFYDDIELYGDSVAIVTEDKENISYKHLVSCADVFKKIITQRCLVFSFSENTEESVIGYIGFLRARVVPFLLSNNIKPDLLKNLVHLYKPSYIWVPKNNAAIIENGTEVHTYKNYVLIKTSAIVDYSIHEDLALLLTTSGSTGSPKLVRQSYKNIISNACAIAEYLNISPNDRPITTLPMSYTFGLSIINSHFLKGSSILLTNKALVDKKFWELLLNNKVTSFSGVPYIFEMLKRLGFSKMNLPDVKKITQAGGKLTPALCEEYAKICEQKRIEFIVMYGQTEATARMSYLPSKYAVSKAGSIGIAIPGGEFWLEDEDCHIIQEINTTGELIYKGDNVTMGYAESCYDLAKGDENGGILKTGDLAQRDADGFYYIVGRNKRFLKLFGNRVNINEIEQLLNDKGFNCVCAGVDNNLKIYLTDKEKLTEAKAFIAEITGINPAGFSVSYIEEIPRNENGKIIYSLLD
jgi:acyl-coenzyme A synthetase/AMP-(fatty) acid ligase